MRQTCIYLIRLLSQSISTAAISLALISLETDDWSFKLDNGHITDYQKGNTYCFNYYGISYWTKEDSARLREDFAQVYNEEPEGNDYFWEFIPLVLAKEEDMR